MPKAHGRRSPWPEKWDFREFPSLQTGAIRGTPGQPPYDFFKTQSLALSGAPQEGGRAPEPAAVFWMGLETALLSSSTLCQHIPEIAHPSKEAVRSPKACKNTLEFKAGCYGQPDQW